MNKLITLIGASSLILLTGNVQADVVHADDVIIQGSGCLGFDCVNDENFGADTIRLKENNLRIHFDDTSSTGSFPNNDWRLVANDQASGGANYFAIEDSTAGKVPFKVTAGAPANAMFISSGGNIGLGTATPALDAHIVNGNTPGIRLEQDGSSGYPAQTWDMSGNEANFFIRDITGGSLLPFRIRPGAPTSSIDIAATGRVGMGTTSPGTPLHVKDINGTAAERDIIQLENNGPTRLLFTNSQSTIPWVFNSAGTSAATSTMIISDDGDGNAEFTLDQVGNLTILGSLTQNSDVNNKDNIQPIDGKSILDKLAALPIKTWKYKQDDPKVRHLGPMAQDFYASFGLGASSTGISVTDSAGVALASIQELHKSLQNKDKVIQSLEERVANLEALVHKLAAAPSSHTLALNQ